MKQSILFCLTVLLSICLHNSSFAQSTIVFQVDMRVQIEDGTFVPSQQSLAIAGNQLPFSRSRTITLRDEAPADSIYTAKVRFPSLVNGKELSYHFIIKDGYKKIEEVKHRTILLNKKDAVLSAVGFNEIAL